MTRSGTRNGWVLPLLITALAAGLRFYDLTAQGLWGDEAFSVCEARGVDLRFMTASLVDVTHRNFVNPHVSLRSILTACLHNEGSPPAYFVLLSLWLKAFGRGEFAVRSLSAVLGTLSVLCLYPLSLGVFRTRAPALLAMLFMAVSPLAIYFSQEARMYALAYPAAIASTWLFLRAIRFAGRKAAWAAYGAAALILCYSFYFAALILVSHFLYLLVCARSAVRAWCVSMAAVAVLYAPWIVFGLATQLHVSGSFSSPWTGTGREFFFACTDRIRYVLDSLILGPMYSGAVIGEGVKLGIEAGLLALFAAGGVRLWRRGERKAVTLCLLLALVPLAVITAFGAYKGTLWYMKPRYHMWEQTGIVLLAAGSIMTFRAVAVRAALAAAFCAFSLAAAPYRFYPGIYNCDHSKPDFRAAAGIVEKGQERGDLVLVNIPGHMIPFNFYYRGGLRQVGIAECGRYDLVGKLDEYTRKRRRVWTLVGMDTVGHGDREITEFLEERFPVSTKHGLHKLKLTLYERGEDGG